MKIKMWHMMMMMAKKGGRRIRGRTVQSVEEHAEKIYNHRARERVQQKTKYGMGMLRWEEEEYGRENVGIHCSTIIA